MLLYSFLNVALFATFDIIGSGIGSLLVSTHLYPLACSLTEKLYSFNNTLSSSTLISIFLFNVRLSV